MLVTCAAKASAISAAVFPLTMAMERGCLPGEGGCVSAQQQPPRPRRARSALQGGANRGPAFPSLLFCVPPRTASIQLYSVQSAGFSDLKVQHCSLACRSKI